MNASGSRKLKWLPTTISGPDSGRFSRPVTWKSVSRAKMAAIPARSSGRRSRRRGWGKASLFGTAPVLHKQQQDQAHQQEGDDREQGYFHPGGLGGFLGEAKRL